MCKEITCSSDGTVEGGPNISGGVQILQLNKFREVHISKSYRGNQFWGVHFYRNRQLPHQWPSLTTSNKGIGSLQWFR